MCDFHSILGVAIGNDYQIRHDSSNSHSGMAGEIKNLPNRTPVIFEVECSAEKLIATADIDTIKARIIRNYGECPEKLVRKIVAHYTNVKEALTTGKHLSVTGYFSDTKKYADVWNEAQSRGVSPDFSGYDEIHCSVYVQQGATFTAPELKEVSGYVYVQQGATFTAPKLTKSGYVDVRQGATFTAPELKEVSGYVDVQQGAKFTAPKLTKSGYVYVRQGATFTAPELKEVSGYVDVQQGATFTAPKLTKSGYVYVRQGAKFTAPKLKEVSGSVDVQQGAKFTAPKLKNR